MNRFMYLSKRHLSNDIKSFYPKCINCINFKREDRSCKKFVTSGNYIDYNSINELADNARNDSTKCGESGILFDIGKEKLEKDNTKVLNTFFSWSLATGILSVVTDEFLLIFFPATITLFTGIIYSIDYYDCNKKINDEKKRIKAYDQYCKIVNKV